MAKIELKLAFLLLLCHQFQLTFTLELDKIGGQIGSLDARLYKGMLKHGFQFPKIIPGSKNRKNAEEPKKRMRTLKLSNFLVYEPEELDELEKFGEEKCACGKHLLREMQQIRYDGWHFRVWPEPLGRGTTSEVFHAHAMSELKDFDGKPIKLNKCVAIKSVLLEYAGADMEEEMRNELAILKEFARMKARRVIRLFSIKEIPDVKQLLFVLELGAEDFRKAMDDLKITWAWFRLRGENSKIEQSLGETSKEILEAVKEMHKLAMHLDLKPQNMLYVDEPNRDGGTNRVLKVIDFGGSLLIPSGSNKQIQIRKRADVCELRDSNWGTRIYRSPEHVNYCNRIWPTMKYEYSIKSDIWAVGVMLLRLLLRTPIIAKKVYAYEHEIVEEAMNLYRGSPIADKNAFYDRDIFSLARQLFPRHFQLIMATFNKKPTFRPTARGMLEYLDGNCRLELPNEQEDHLLEADQEKLFLQQIAEDKRKFGGNTCDTKTTGSTSLLSNEASSEENKENAAVKNANRMAIERLDNAVKSADLAIRRAKLEKARSTIR